MTTLKDIAKAAGVSVTTASLVANDKGAESRISPDTVARVLAVMEELNYRPNEAARRLRSSAVPRTTIAFYWPSDIRSNLLGTRLMHFFDVVQEQGLDYEIVVQTYRIQHIENFLDPVRRGKYDGIIVGGLSDDDVIQLEQAELTIPVILLNRESHRYSTVGVNNSDVGMQAAAVLHKKGFPSCGLVKSEDRFMGSSQRLKTFLYACRQLEIDIRPEWTFTGAASIRGGAQAVEEFCALTERPPVLFFEHDNMAQGGLCTLLRAGLRVPEDVSMLAISTLAPERMEYLVPSISCVSLPQNVDRQAMYTMIRIIKEQITEPIHVQLEPRTQLRDSLR